MRILLLDDETLIRRVLRTALERFGHQVVTAAGGCEGMDRLEEGGIELIVCDVRMPRMNGLEMAAKVRQRDPGLPFVLVSGQSDDAIASAGSRLGVHCMAKPIGLRELLEYVERAGVSRHESPPLPSPSPGA